MQIRIQDTTSLFHRLVNNMRKCYEIPLWKIKKAAQYFDSNSPGETDAKTLTLCIAHVMFFSPILTEFTFKHFLTILDNEPMNIEDREFSVVSIGGGPGNDVIGFINAICEKHLIPQKLNVTIVDKNRIWQVFFSVAVSEILAWGATTPLSKFLDEVHFAHKFVDAEIGDCDQISAENVRRSVENANLVICSVLNTSKEYTKEMFEEILRPIKDDRFLYLENVDAISTESSRILHEKFTCIYCRNDSATIPDNTEIMNYMCSTFFRCKAALFKKRYSMEYFDSEKTT